MLAWGTQPKSVDVLYRDVNLILKTETENWKEMGAYYNTKPGPGETGGESDTSRNLGLILDTFRNVSKLTTLEPTSLCGGEREKPAEMKLSSAERNGTLFGACKMAPMRPNQSHGANYLLS